MSSHESPSAENKAEVGDGEEETEDEADSESHVHVVQHQATLQRQDKVCCSPLRVPSPSLSARSAPPSSGGASNNILQPPPSCLGLPRKLGSRDSHASQSICETGLGCGSRPPVQFDGSGGVSVVQNARLHPLQSCHFQENHGLHHEDQEEPHHGSAEANNNNSTNLTPARSEPEMCGGEEGDSNLPYKQLEGGSTSPAFRRKQCELHSTSARGSQLSSRANSGDSRESIHSERCPVMLKSSSPSPLAKRRQVQPLDGPGSHGLSPNIPLITTSGPGGSGRCCMGGGASIMRQYSHPEPGSLSPHGCTRCTRGHSSWTGLNSEGHHSPQLHVPPHSPHSQKGLSMAGDGIATIAADSMRINGAFRQFKQLEWDPKKIRHERKEKEKRDKSDIVQPTKSEEKPHGSESCTPSTTATVTPTATGGTSGNPATLKTSFVSLDEKNMGAMSGQLKTQTNRVLSTISEQSQLLSPKKLLALQRQTSLSVSQPRLSPASPVFRGGSIDSDCSANRGSGGAGGSIGSGAGTTTRAILPGVSHAMAAQKRWRNQLPPPQYDRSLLVPTTSVATLVHRSDCGLRRANAWQSYRKHSEPSISISLSKDDYEGRPMNSRTFGNSEDDMFLPPPRSMLIQRRSSSVVAMPMHLTPIPLMRSTSMRSSFKNPSIRSPTEGTDMNYIASSIVKKKNPLLAKVESKGGMGSHYHHFNNTSTSSNSTQWFGLKKFFSKSHDESNEPVREYLRKTYVHLA